MKPRYCQRAATTLALLTATTVLGACSTPHLKAPGNHGPQCPSIQAAATITFSGDRSSALQEIASTPNLGEHEQIYLVQTVVHEGGFSADVVAPLLALLANPSATTRTRSVIANCLARLHLFSADEKRLTVALRRSADQSDTTRPRPK